MQNYIEKIQSYTGFKRYLISFVLGCLTALALSPVYLILAAIIGFTAHLHQIDVCKNQKQSFWLGWFFGLGFFVVGLYWISFALLVDVQQFGWMIPFAMFGIPAVLSFYTAICSLITSRIKQTGSKKVILFAVIWTSIEMLRGVLFTGFPWNLIGYIWTVSNPMLQITSILGIWGLSFITVLAFTMPYTINWQNKKGTLRPSIFAFAILAITFTFGQLRLISLENQFHHEKIRIIQGNISQHEKWDDNFRSNIIKKYLTMTASKPFYAVKYVLWPEAAIPTYMQENSFLTESIGRVTPSNGYIITGSVRAERSNLGFIDNIYNSIHTIDENGNTISIYDKHHLVPFGEYVPFRSILPIEKITPGQMDFGEGAGIQTISIPNMPSFSPLICYEAIFPNKVINKQELPDLMINVTNDAWYGNSSGPYQHFEMVRVRAIEHGIPLARAANTGISGVIGPMGRIIEKTELGEDAVLDSKIPKALNSPTLYTKFGNIIIILIMLAVTIVALFHKKDV